jgi:ABC transport system ATP-binding/permease protein
MSSPLRAYHPDPGKPFQVGRGDTCALVLHDPAVSRLHATISWERNAGWNYQNHSTTSGTWCGDEKIESRQLQDGDILQLGVQQLRFVIQGHELTLLHIAPSEDFPPATLEQGKTVAIGRTANSALVINHPACPLELARATLVQANCLLRFRVPTVDDQGKKRRKLKLTPGQWADLPWGTLHFSNGQLSLHSRGAGLAVCVEELSVTKGERTLLAGVSFDLEPGQLLSVIGLSGQGKTTLLHALGQSRAPQQGRILFDGRPHQRFEAQTSLAVLPQEPLLRDALTVRETLQEAARLCLPADHATSEINERIAGLLSLVALEHRATTRAGVLSGGERRRLALAAQLMGGPGLLLLDEPLSGLDPVNTAKLCTHLRQLAWLGHTIILTTHSYAALEISDRVLVIHQGAQAFFGNRDEAFQFFNSSDAESLLGKLPHKSGQDWSTLYRRSRFEKTRIATRAAPQAPPTLTLFPLAPRPLALLRFLRLEWRQWTRDRGRAAAVLLQPLLIGLLLRQVFVPGTSLWAAAFALLLCANWFALSLSIRSIVAERALLADEARGHNHALDLLAAKAVIPVSLALVQSLVCWSLFGPALGAHPPWAALTVALATTVFPAVATGIAASALCRNAGQANALLPLLLIPQLALAGALAPLDQMTLAGASMARAVWSSHTQALLQDLFTGGTLDYTSCVIPVGTALGIFIIDGYLLARLRKNP